VIQRADLLSAPVSGDLYAEIRREPLLTQISGGVHKKVQLLLTAIAIYVFS
jgi:hypothetical protein